jgi:uncharacterized membrane protein SirB2
MYAALKQVHLVTVTVSFCLFFVRGLWMVRDSEQLHRRWVRIVPHLNDTVLLLSAIGMLTVIGQSPFAIDWLTAKIVALVLYILAGTVAIKRGPTKSMRIGAWLLAMAIFGYIASVGLTHDPRGPLVLLSAGR